MMVKDNLERKALKAVLNIEKKVVDINNILNDLSLKLCHIIKSKQHYHYGGKENGYKNEKW